MVASPRTVAAQRAVGLMRGVYRLPDGDIYVGGLVSFSGPSGTSPSSASGSQSRSVRHSERIVAQTPGHGLGWSPRKSGLYCYGKGVPRISAKNQITLPVAVLDEAGLRSGDEVVVEALDDGELRVRRGARRFEHAFGALTGIYPEDYLARLDAEDDVR